MLYNTLPNVHLLLLLIQVKLIDFGETSYKVKTKGHCIRDKAHHYQQFPFLAPELAYGFFTSTKTDVFSYGKLRLTLKVILINVLHAVLLCII
jgi:serine/threonine protein kinase